MVEAMKDGALKTNTASGRQLAEESFSHRQIESLGALLIIVVRRPGTWKTEKETLV